MRENRMDENVTIVYTAYVTLRNGHRLYAKQMCIRDSSNSRIRSASYWGGCRSGTDSTPCHGGRAPCRTFLPPAER